MPNIIQTTRRQIEILSLVDQSPNTYSVADLCELFGVEFITIYRDLRELRSQGFQIYSVKRRLRLIKPLAVSDYNKLLSMYLLLSDQAIGYPKNIALTTKRLKERSLETFVALVRAIEDRREIDIEYYKVFDDEIVTRRVQPYQLFPTVRDWRLIGWSEGYFKQFFVDNIRKITVLDKRFARDSSFDLQQFFQEAWETFQSEHPTTVQLRFSKRVARIIKNRVWSENQTLEEQDDASVVITLPVANLDEIVGWVMGWGKEVKVIEPKALSKLVRKKAIELLKK